MKEPVTKLASYKFSIQRDEKAIEYYRSGINDEVGTVLDSIRSQKNLPDLLASDLTLDDVKLTLYQQDLKICQEPEIVIKTAPNLAEFTANGPLPEEILSINSGMVAWVKAPEGGVMPILKQISMAAGGGIRLLSDEPEAYYILRVGGRRNKGPISQELAQPRITVDGYRSLLTCISENKSY